MLERVARQLADVVLTGDADINSTYAAAGKPSGGPKPGKGGGKGKGAGKPTGGGTSAGTLSQVALVAPTLPWPSPPSASRRRPTARSRPSRTAAPSAPPKATRASRWWDCPTAPTWCRTSCARRPPSTPSVTYSTLREAGVPVPDSYGFPGYVALQESSHVVLQAIKLGRVAVTVCPCEMFTEQARNIRSRLDRTPGNLWFGFDWTATQRFSPDYEPGVAYLGDLLPDAPLGEASAAARSSSTSTQPPPVSSGGASRTTAPPRPPGPARTRGR
jgi:hypothetical protein